MLVHNSQKIVVKLFFLPDGVKSGSENKKQSQPRSQGLLFPQVNPGLEMSLKSCLKRFINSN